MRFLVFLVLCGCPIVVPQIAQDSNALCAQLIAQQRLDEAEAACDHALEYQPRYWDALHNKGLIAQARGDKKTAKEFFIKALRANEHMMQTLNSLGALEMEEGNLPSAANYFLAALRVEPNYLEARRNIGFVRLQQKDFAEAARQFRLLLIANGQLVEGHLGLASALMAQSQFEEACGVIERANTLDVGDDRAWLMRAACEKERGRLDQVKDALERCLLANEKNLECQKVLKAIGD